MLECGLVPVSEARGALCVAAKHGASSQRAVDTVDVQHGTFSLQQLRVQARQQGVRRLEVIALLRVRGRKGEQRVDRDS